MYVQLDLHAWCTHLDIHTDGWKFSPSVLYDIVRFGSDAQLKIKYDERTGRGK